MLTPQRPTGPGRGRHGKPNNAIRDTNGEVVGMATIAGVAVLSRERVRQIVLRRN